MAEIISAVYKIVNTITGDFYIGSSKDVKRRWTEHKCQSTWKNNPNKQLYKDMRKYGLGNFDFQILAEVEIEQLKKMEQQFIELLKPTYNNINANGLNIERQKKHKKEYEKSDKRKESHRKSDNKYYNQPCLYNGKKLTLSALSSRFYRAGIEHPVIEAKKYLIL